MLIDNSISEAHVVLVKLSEVLKLSFEEAPRGPSSWLNELRDLKTVDYEMNINK